MKWVYWYHEIFVLFASCLFQMDSPLELNYVAQIGLELKASALSARFIAVYNYGWLLLILWVNMFKISFNF